MRIHKVLCSFICLSLCAPWAFAQSASGIQSRENRFSFGWSAGILSGVTGLTGRYWMNDWGFQVTALPAYEKSKYGHNSAFMGGVQAMRRLNVEMPRLHEPGGYVHSVAYNYVGLSTLYIYDTNQYGSPESNPLSVFLGGGFGLETFWRNWRLATGVGVAFMVNDDYERYLLPSLDVTLSYGI